MSIHGWDITTLVFFEKETSAIYEFYFRFRFRSYNAIRTLFCIMLLNFIQIGPPAAEIWRHIHFSRWRPQPLNTTSGFDFDHISVICVIFCIKLPNFIHIGSPNAVIWRHINFSRWLPRLFNFSSGFLLVDATVFGRSKSISRPNFVDIHPFVAEI